MTKHHISDPRRLAAAVDRLDAVSAADRRAAAKHVYDVCVYHVARVRRAAPTPTSASSASSSTTVPQHPRGHGRRAPLSAAATGVPPPSAPHHLSSSPAAAVDITHSQQQHHSQHTHPHFPTPPQQLHHPHASPPPPPPPPLQPPQAPSVHYVFDAIHPHIYRIARRLDRAMRHAEASPHANDAAALICAVDTQGALAALFAVAQNAGVDAHQLDVLALPLRKRSAPALLRTLFSPDMRVANAAKKALRQVITIASCQNSPWMSTIRSALSLRTAARVNRSVQLRNLLSRLAEILHLVIKQAASSKLLLEQQAMQSQNQQYFHQQQQHLLPLQHVNTAHSFSSHNNADYLGTTAAAARKRGGGPVSRTSIASLVTAKPRPSLNTDYRAATFNHSSINSGAASVSGGSTHSLAQRMSHLLFRRRHLHHFQRQGRDTLRSSSRVTVESDGFTTLFARRRQHKKNTKRPSQPQSFDSSAIGAHIQQQQQQQPSQMFNGDDDWYSVASAGLLSTGGASYPGSVFSSITESGMAGTNSSVQHQQINPKQGYAPHSRHRQHQHHQQQQLHTASNKQNNKSGSNTASGTIKRDAATAMYIFERLLAKRTNPDLADRVQVLKVLADIAMNTFSPQYSTLQKNARPEDYAEAMTAVFERHGHKMYSVILDILFRPVRGEAEADRIGIFSFHEPCVMEMSQATTAGTADVGGGAAGDAIAAGAGQMASPGRSMMTHRKTSSFPKSAICLPNMECSADGATTSNCIMRLFLRHVPQVCAPRMALVTGCVNTAFLNCSEALVPSSCRWDMPKLVRACDSLTVLVAAVPATVDAALRLVVSDAVALRLVVETCMRSLSATGRLMAQNAARYSAPRMSDQGTLDSLRSWQRLIKILPPTAQWNGTPSYSSSILFLAQVARRAALIAVLKNRRKAGNSKDGKQRNRDSTSTNNSKQRYSSYYQQQQGRAPNIVAFKTGDGDSSNRANVMGPGNMDRNVEDNAEITGHLNGNEAQNINGVVDDVVADTPGASLPPRTNSEKFVPPNSSPSSYSSYGAAVDGGPGPDEFDDLDDDDNEQEHILVTELQQSISDMISVPGTNASDIFFELYRTVVYLYANDLKKQAKNAASAAVASKRVGEFPNQEPYNPHATEFKGSSHSPSTGPGLRAVTRTQSDEDAKGILVENIAVDGQLPSRALRRAVMASEIDLGEYFDTRHVTHSPSANSITNKSSMRSFPSQPRDDDFGYEDEYGGRRGGEQEGDDALGQGHQRRTDDEGVNDGNGNATNLNEDDDAMSVGVYTFEEFAHALAIIMGILCKRIMIEDTLDKPASTTNTGQTPGANVTHGHAHRHGHHNVAGISTSATDPAITASANMSVKNVNASAEHHEAEATVSMIGRDVYRSGSSYLRKVHKRAKAIMKKDLAARQMDWRTQKYELRIKRLEDQVASLKNLVQSSLEGYGSSHMSRRRSMPKIANLCGCTGKRDVHGVDDDDDDDDDAEENGYMMMKVNYC